MSFNDVITIFKNYALHDTLFSIYFLIKCKRLCPTMTHFSKYIFLIKYKRYVLFIVKDFNVECFNNLVVCLQHYMLKRHYLY